MGKEISYCHGCGNRLLETEQAAGQVYIHENRRFCRSCCPSLPPAETVPMPQRRHSSTRLRMQQPPGPRPRETTRIRRRNPLGLILGASAAAALAIGIALAAGGSPSVPPPPPAAPAPVQAQAEPKPVAPPPLDEALSRIREIRQSDLMFERRAEVLALLKEASGRAGPRLEEVDQLSADYDRKFEQAAARLADFTRAEAMRMAAKQKYAEAIERLDGYPAAFKTSASAEQLRALRRDFERRQAESAAQPPSQPPRQVVRNPRWRS